MARSQWLVPPFLTSIFFFLGIITLYWSVFTWFTHQLELHQQNASTKRIQCLVGLGCSVVAIFGIQLLSHASADSWVFTSFQLLILIFIAYFLQVWIPTGAIVVAGVAFMALNGGLTHPFLWGYTFLYAAFYLVLYLQSVRMWPHPLLRYLVTVLVFGSALWGFVAQSFRLSWVVGVQSVSLYLVLAGLMYGYFCIQDRDLRIKDRLFQAANWDALTRVKNYAAYDRELAADYQTSVAEHRDLAMIMFDIDHFKRINDTYGHLMGDQVLKQVSLTVTKVLNRHGRLTLYRTGGEEFNIIAPDTTMAAAHEIAKELFDAVNQLEITHNGQSLTVTLSVGVSELAVNDQSPLDFYKRVDGNLYQSKRNGRRRITVDAGDLSNI